MDEEDDGEWWWWWGSRVRRSGVVEFVGASAGRGSGGGEVGCIAGSSLSVLVGGDEVGGEDGASLVGEGAGSDFGLNGVLRGDLKGWDRVFVAVFRRRRFEGCMGDIVGIGE